MCSFIIIFQQQSASDFCSCLAFQSGRHLQEYIRWQKHYNQQLLGFTCVSIDSASITWLTKNVHCQCSVSHVIHIVSHVISSEALQLLSWKSIQDHQTAKWFPAWSRKSARNQPQSDAGISLIPKVTRASVGIPNLKSNQMDPGGSKK